MSDYLFMLARRLGARQRQLFAQVEQAAAQAQMHLFLAGGAMRDLLAGLPIRDLDFCVEGPALTLVRRLDRKSFAVVSSDERQQSAEMLFAGTWPLEIAMCRQERYAKSGGRAEITRATIQDDLRRRDLTVNAIALSLSAGSRGLLLDPANGLADITRKELRALHNYSFYDDPSRLLRLIRFQSRLQYSIEEKTQAQFASALESGVLEQIPPRLLWRELAQLAREPDTAHAVKALSSFGLLPAFEPHLQPNKIDLPALRHLDKCRRLVEDSGVRVNTLGPFLYGLTRKLSAAERANLRTRIGLSAAGARLWTELEARGKGLQKGLPGKSGSQNSNLFRLLSDQDPALTLFLFAFSPLQPVRERLRHYFAKLRPLARDVTEREIEQLGVKPDSPKFARVREAYLTARLDNKIKKKADPARLLRAGLSADRPGASPAPVADSRSRAASTKPRPPGLSGSPGSV